MTAAETFAWPERPLVALHGHALAEKDRTLMWGNDVRDYKGNFGQRSGPMTDPGGPGEGGSTEAANQPRGDTFQYAGGPTDHGTEIYAKRKFPKRTKPAVLGVLTSYTM